MQAATQLPERLRGAFTKVAAIFKGKAPHVCKP